MSKFDNEKTYQSELYWLLWKYQLFESSLPIIKELMDKQFSSEFIYFLFLAAIRRNEEALLHSEGNLAIPYSTLTSEENKDAAAALWNEQRKDGKDHSIFFPHFSDENERVNCGARIYASQKKKLKQLKEDIGLSHTDVVTSALNMYFDFLDTGVQQEPLEAAYIRHAQKVDIRH